MRLMLKFLATVAAFTAVPASAALVHDYRLDGALTDALGGPALVSEGGTLGATGYSFTANQGLVLANIVPASVYSIEVAFRFDTVSGYRKIIDFKSLTSDAGAYILSGGLNFYPITSGSSILANNQLATAVFTRDASGLVTGYLGGVQQLAFTDSSNLATFSDPQQLARLFHDDNATGGRESSGGFADYIRIYDTALSSSEVASLTPPAVGGAVPEPASWGMMIIGFGVVGGAARRRRQIARVA